MTKGSPWSTEPCRVDEQGRTIIPRDIREALGLEAGKGYVMYEVEGDSVRVRKVEWVVR